MKRGDLFFFNSLFLSRLSDQLLLFLVPLVVYKVTGSASISGLAFFLETLPRFISFPISGILCDFFSPLKLIRYSQRFRFIIIIVGLLGYQFENSIYWLVAISSFTGIATSFGMMSRELILPQVFNTNIGKYEKTLSYTSLSDQAGMVFGPLLASYLISMFSWQISILFSAALFLISDLSIYIWKISLEIKIIPKNKGKINFLNASKVSFLNIFKLPGLFPSIILAICINFILGTTLATMAPIFIGHFNQTNYAYGLLQSLGAVSTIVVLLLVVKKSIPLILLGILGFSFMSLGALLTSFSQEYIIYSIGFLLILGFDKMFNVFLRSLRARVIPIKDLGKTTGFIILLNNIAQPLSGLLVAVYSTQTSPQNIVFIVSILCITIGLSVLFYLFFKNGRQLISL
ncbi:MFS transporter [Marinomonas sp. TI.3.20]|uniref:MFS transporter n=1 Tax=Marinomonas sp. TI.3.20 TaxID=3121296 RepID=UPI00311EC48C